MKLIIDTFLIFSVLLISDRVSSQVMTDIGTQYDEIIYHEMIMLDLEREIEDVTINLSDRQISLQALEEQRQDVLTSLNACGCTREHRNNLIDELLQYDLDIQSLKEYIEELYVKLEDLNNEYESHTSPMQR